MMPRLIEAEDGLLRVPLFLIEHDGKTTTSRAGWAPLSRFAPRYALPDGRIVAIRVYEDLDYIGAERAKAAGVTLEPETHREKAKQGGADLPADPAAQARHAEALGYVAGYAGTWGLPLDIRADRRWGTKYMKLTERQVEVLLAGKARDEQRQQERQARPAAQPAADGIYRLDGAIYKVVRAVAQGSGRPYAKRLVLGEPGENARWEYARGVVFQLRPEHALTVEEAMEFGHLYGICIACGRALTDETSIERGIGPICEGRMRAGVTVE